MTHASSSAALTKHIIRLAIGTLLLLLIPLALTIRDGNVPNVGWNWSPGDFLFAFVMIFGSGLAYLLISRLSGNMLYKCGVGLAILTSFALIWGNAAVGFIGDEQPINMLYVLIPIMGLAWSAVTRFKARSMMQAAFTAAVLQMLIPVIALAIGVEDFSPGVLQVFALSAAFAAMWTAAGVMLRITSPSHVPPPSRSSSQP